MSGECGGARPRPRGTGHFLGRGAPPERVHAAILRRLASPARASLLVALVQLAGCGVDVLVQRQDVALTSASGEKATANVAWRTPDGILNLEPPERRWWIGFLLEPVDWCDVVGVGATAAFRDDRDLALGPLGRLCALTPFATVFPAPEGRLPDELATDDALFARMRAGDVEAARAAFGDDRIRAVWFR